MMCRFSAKGEWMDRSITCGPAGASDGDFQAGEVFHLAGTLWGKVEKLFKRITKNENAEFRGTRREEDMPWFALVGAVANAGNPKPDGTPARHEVYIIGEGRDFRPKQPGYLWCFANDAWQFYGNNRGSVTLTVERL